MPFPTMEIIICAASIYHSCFEGASYANMWKTLQTFCNSTEGSTGASGGLFVPICVFAASQPG